MPEFMTVLRPHYDCTNGGVTSKATHVFLIDEHEEIPTQAHLAPEKRLPVLRKVVRWRGTAEEYVHAEPVNPPPKSIVMFGGNYIDAGGHSGTIKLPKYPIPVHDRCETQEQYDRLTR